MANLLLMGNREKVRQKLVIEELKTVPGSIFNRKILEEDIKDFMQHLCLMM